MNNIVLLLVRFLWMVVILSCASRTREQEKDVASTPEQRSAMAGAQETLEKHKSYEPFRFVQLCDTQLGFGDYEHDVHSFKQAVRQINALEPDFVVICGDLVNTPNDKSFADFNQIKAGFRVPCYCAPGNHDIRGHPTPESLQYYREVIGRDYFAFEHKGSTFVVVNTQFWKVTVPDESEKHDAWFEATLRVASEKGHRIFVIGHYPLFVNNPDEAEEYMNLPVEKRKELLRLFESRNVVAMLGGHTHRLIVHDYRGIQLVNAESTSRNLDEGPAGFRVWHVGDTTLEHEFTPLQEF